jgi:hypothetical protein
VSSVVSSVENDVMDGWSITDPYPNTEEASIEVINMDVYGYTGDFITDGGSIVLNSTTTSEFTTSNLVFRVMERWDDTIYANYKNVSYEGAIRGKNITEYKVWYLLYDVGEFEISTPDWLKVEIGEYHPQYIINNQDKFKHLIK